MATRQKVLKVQYPDSPVLYILLQAVPGEQNFKYGLNGRPFFIRVLPAIRKLLFNYGRLATIGQGASYNITHVV